MAKTAKAPVRSREVRKPWYQLADRELEKLVRDLDDEMVIDQFRAPSAAQRGEWLRAKRGRPVVGRGAERISLTIERGLLEEADAIRADVGLNRSQLVAIGLRAILAARRRTRRRR